MAEFDDKLNALLSDPNAMNQIMQLAQSLSGAGAVGADGTGPAAPPAPAVPPTQPPPPQAAQTSGPAGTNPLSALAGGLDPKLLARLLPLLQELNSGNDSNARALLFALRPYLKPDRQEKVERALQLARMIHIGKKLLAGWGE